MELSKTRAPSNLPRVPAAAVQLATRLIAACGMAHDRSELFRAPVADCRALAAAHPCICMESRSPMPRWQSHWPASALAICALRCMLLRCG